jgi:cell envelope opacity-associated protein A
MEGQLHQPQDQEVLQIQTLEDFLALQQQLQVGHLLQMHQQAAVVVAVFLQLQLDLPEALAQIHLHQFHQQQVLHQQLEMEEMEQFQLLDLFLRWL